MAARFLLSTCVMRTASPPAIEASHPPTTPDEDVYLEGLIFARPRRPRCSWLVLAYHGCSSVHPPAIRFPTQRRRSSN